MSTLKDRIAEEVNQGFSQISSTVVSSTTEIMGGALNSLISDVKSLATGTMNIVTGTFKTIIGPSKSPELVEDEKQTSILHGIFSIFKKQDKENSMQYEDRSEDSLLDLGTFGMVGLVLGGLVGSVVATIGGVLKSFLIPFEIIGSAIKNFLSIGNWFSKTVAFISQMLGKSKIGQIILNTFGKIGGFFSKIFGFLSGIFSKVIGVFTEAGGFLTKIPILGKFFAGFARGFGTVLKGIPVIGWAITIIMGIIDFFKGFTKTEGGFFAKLKGGLIAMLTGLFDPIFGIFGWLADKILGLFGINIEGGSGAKMMEGFKNALEWCFDILGSVFGGLWSGIKLIGKLLMGVWNIISPFIMSIGSIFTGIIDVGKSILSGDINKIGNSVINLIGDLFNSVKKYLKIVFFPVIWIIDKIKDLITGGEDISFIDKIKEMLGNIGNSIKDIFSKSIDVIITPFKWVSNKISELISWFSTISFSDMFSTVIDSIKKVFSWYWNVITTPFKWVSNKISELISWFSTNNDEDTSFIDKIKEMLGNIGTAIKEWILDKIPGAKFLSKGINGIKSWFSSDNEETPEPLQHKDNSNVTPYPINKSNKEGKLPETQHSSLSKSILNPLNWFSSDEEETPEIYKGQEKLSDKDLSRMTSDQKFIAYNNRVLKDAKSRNNIDDMKLASYNIQQTKSGTNYKNPEEYGLKYNEESRKLESKNKKFKNTTNNVQLIESEEERKIKIQNLQKKKEEERTSKQFEQNKKIIQNVNKPKETTKPNVINNNNMSSSSSKGKSDGGFTEGPDEIENFGLVFMNKTTLGSAL